MRRRIYRAMDSELVFFGIRGGYRKFLLMSLAASAFLSLAAGSAMGIVAGVVALMVLVVASYAVLLSLQERMDYRTLLKRRGRRRFPVRIYVRRHMSDMIAWRTGL